MADGEEEMKVSVGEPLPRVVFGGAPSLQEATEATSNLKHALKKYRFPYVDIFRGDISELSPILICNIVRFSSSSFPDSDYKIDESIVDADSFSQSSRRISSSKSEAEESKFGNSFIDFLQNVTRTVTQTMVDIMNSLSDFFNNLFRGNKVFFNADGSAN
ncbi:hypothetical protein T459_02794 [Capsicum annuum]|uniref:Uncharacterized protein n=1 Tax=Capsicum annuum TaxID=4072 RepID=A0A2G3AL09_CAPAN|nr:hypothetical protein T459_02794 [Capsicum annuum]